jgi:SNF2 family DNA or RNA helicase
LPALVVAPKRVAEHVWPAERSLWRPDLTLALAAGTPQQRQAALGKGADVTVIGRDNLADAEAYRYCTVVLDEMSSFRSRSTARWKAARRIVSKAQHVWGLTGTPSPNGYLDLWAQVFLLDKGARLGTSLGGYRDRYFVARGQLPSGVLINWEPRPTAEARIRGLIEDLCLYMSSADELDLPPVNYNTVQVDMPPVARRQYEEFRKDLVLHLEKETHSASSSVVLTNKLSQVSAGFVFSDAQDGSYTPLHNAKLEALGEVIDGTGDNILVFYNYIPESERIRQAFPQARMVDEPGVLAAWTRGEVPLMLAHPASAGHGLNLQAGGHTVVWSSLTWDLELYLQANARLARQGQNHPVIVHSLECEGTVDKVISDRLHGKATTQQELLNFLKSPL